MSQPDKTTCSVVGEEALLADRPADDNVLLIGMIEAKVVQVDGRITQLCDQRASRVEEIPIVVRFLSQKRWADPLFQLSIEKHTIAINKL